MSYRKRIKQLLSSLREERDKRESESGIVPPGRYRVEVVDLQVIDMGDDLELRWTVRILDKGPCQGRQVLRTNIIQPAQEIFISNDFNTFGIPRVDFEEVLGCAGLREQCVGKQAIAVVRTSSPSFCRINHFEQLPRE